MKDVSFGQYYPVNSVIHRLDPRVKLLMVIAYIVMIFFINTFFAYGIVAVFLLFIILLSRVPLTKILRSLKAIIFLVIFTTLLSVFFYSSKTEAPLVSWGIIKIYKTGLFNAGKMALRLIFLVTGPSLLSLTTTPVELTDGLESLLKPLALIKLPIHELAMIMSIALRLIPNLIEETEKIISAQKARLAEFESRNLFKRIKALLPVLIPLFVSSFRRADDLANAMDARCYGGAKKRTRMKKLRLHVRDFIAFFILASLFFLILLIKYNWFAISFFGVII